MTSGRRLVLVLGLWVVTASAAIAQPLVNPTRAEWVSDDHAMVARYELAYYAGPTAQEPITVVNVGKPSTCAPCAVPLPPKPVFGAGLVARVRAVAADGSVSGWSDASNPFDLRLAQPAQVIVRQ